MGGVTDKTEVTFLEKWKGTLAIVMQSYYVFFTVATLYM